MASKDRHEHYWKLVDGVDSTDESVRYSTPKRWFTMSRELANGNITDTRISTHRNHMEALEQLADDVRHGLHPDPDTALVDLETGLVQPIKVQVTVTIDYDRAAA